LTMSYFALVFLLARGQLAYVALLSLNYFTMTRCVRGTRVKSHS
jgi:hypothetical protein